MKHYLNFCLFLIFSTLSAQVTIAFQPVLEGEALQLVEEGAVPRSGNSSSGPHISLREGAAAGAGKVVSILRFYLSDVALLNAGQVVSTSSKRHYLLDAGKPETMQLPLSVQKGVIYDELRFTLGVDSLTAASGAFGADLDPTNGMYWTWRSGYINFKLEGTAPECPARKHRFQFHVGGFQGPFNSGREVRLKVSPSITIPVRINLDHFFDQTDLSTKYQVMSPNEEAMQVANLLVEVFRFSDSE